MPPKLKTERITTHARERTISEGNSRWHAGYDMGNIIRFEQVCELGPNELLFFFVIGYLPRSKYGPLMYATVRDSYNSQHIPSRCPPPHAVAEMMDTTMTDNSIIKR